MSHRATASLRVVPIGNTSQHCNYGYIHMRVTWRKQQRPGIATDDNNSGTNRITNNPTMQPTNSQRVQMCWIVVSVARVYRVGVWFGFVRSALLLAVVLCWVDCCFDSWVLLGLLCFLRVTPHVQPAAADPELRQERNVNTNATRRYKWSRKGSECMSQAARMHRQLAAGSVVPRCSGCTPHSRCARWRAWPHQEQSSQRIWVLPSYLSAG